MATTMKRVRVQNTRKQLLLLTCRQCARPLSRSALCYQADARQQSDPFEQLNNSTSKAGNDFVSPDPELAHYRSENLTSLAHRELEQHRELREMVRLAAWEMPLLAQLSKPFEPPAKEQVLRWRYTTYMGEAHPAARKVVVEFEPSQLTDLTEQQLLKLLKLAGARYNPTKRIIKMSSESFETQAQNKRYLGETINKMIAEAKDSNADSFEDVPLDLRHHKPPQTARYPQSWILTSERQKQLEESRRVRLLEEGKMVEQGAILSGKTLIEEGWQRIAEQARQTVMVESRSVNNRRPVPHNGQGQQRPQRR